MYKEYNYANRVRKRGEVYVLEKALLCSRTLHNVREHFSAERNRHTWWWHLQSDQWENFRSARISNKPLDYDVLHIWFGFIVTKWAWLAALRLLLGAETREFQCGITLFESKGLEFGANSHASWYVNVSTLSVCCYIDDTEKL